MIWLGAWAILGALIGASAAQQRGFAMAPGILVGFLLGPLAVLMFAVSADRQKCPHCAEWMRREAKVCPHCQRDVA